VASRGCHTTTIIQIRPAPAVQVVSLPIAPVLLNHYYRHVGHRTLISAAGKRYRKDIATIIAASGALPMPGRLAVTIEVHPASSRSFDVDGVPKGLLDACTHAGLWPDDSLIDDLHVVRRGVVPGGRIVMTVRTIEKS
jgi:crossover junction endodeoxyribonuclease RusA